MEYSQQALGNRIAEYRTLRNMSQSDLSNASGVTKAYISNLELGKGGSISLEKLDRIAIGLNVSLDALLVDSLVKYSSENDRMGEKLSTCNSLQLKLFHNFLIEFVKYKRTGLPESD